MKVQIGLTVLEVGAQALDVIDPQVRKHFKDLQQAEKIGINAIEHADISDPFKPIRVMAEHDGHCKGIENTILDLAEQRHAILNELHRELKAAVSAADNLEKGIADMSGLSDIHLAEALRTLALNASSVQRSATAGIVRTLAAQAMDKLATKGLDKPSKAASAVKCGAAARELAFRTALHQKELEIVKKRQNEDWRELHQDVERIKAKIDGSEAEMFNRVKHVPQSMIEFNKKAMDELAERTNNRMLARQMADNEEIAKLKTQHKSIEHDLLLQKQIFIQGHRATHGLKPIQAKHNAVSIYGDL